MYHDWLTSYLKNRSQFVHYNDYNSERKTDYSLGSARLILGPLLLIIYIHEFSRASPYVITHEPI